MSIFNFSPSFFPYFPPPPTPRRRRSSQFLATTHSSPNPITGPLAVLWLKHDLRIHDHPALHAASSHFPSLIPLYIFDSRILSRFEQVKATHVFVEEEVEYELCLLMDDVSQTLSTLIRSPDLTIWRTPFYDIKSVEAIPESYDEFKKLQLPVTCPLSSPTLPCLEMELDWGTMPTLDALKEFMNSTRLNEPSDEWDSIKNTTAEAMVRAKFSKRGSNENNPSSREFRTERMGNSIFSTQRGKNFMMGGTEGVLNALAAYIRYNEGTSRDDWQALHEMVRNSESRDGASFIKLFGPAIHLGIVSKRKVHYEAVKYEKERNAGFLSPFGYSARTVAAAVDAVLSSEDRQVSIAAWLGARLLLSYLRLKTKDILKNCYPTRTDRADDWLVNEMLRAITLTDNKKSKDPGGLVLLESIFSFDLTVPLNYLLERLEGRVLIIQGMKDPIYNSKSLLGKLKEHCAWVMIKELNAGHCPHDELPEEVNSTLCEWIVRMEST